MAIKLSQEAKVLLGVGLIAAILIGITAFAADSTDEEELSLSTYSTRTGGAKATFALIEELGYHAERWKSAPQALPEEASNTLFILLAPDRRPKDDERLALERYVARGGTLLLSGYDGALWVSGLGLQPDIPSRAWYGFGLEAPHALNRDASVITMPKGLYSYRSDIGIPLYGEKGKRVAVVVPRGKGRILWLASGVPLSNAGLKAPGNAEFLGNVLAFAGSRHVYWDLYFSEDAPGKHSPFNTPTLLVASAQLLFIFVLIVFTHSRRSGPLRAFREGPLPMAQMEFVDTLGSLYQNAKATNVAVQIAYGRFAYLAARRFATSPSDLDKLAQSISHATGEGADKIVEFLTECDNIQYHAPLTREEALKRVQRLQDYAAKLKLIPQKTTEK